MRITIPCWMTRVLKCPNVRVDVNMVEGNSCSALMIACMHGFCEVATEILLREDCDVNIGVLSSAVTY